MASQPNSANGKAMMSGESVPPKRFKGDSHAVVAMIFRSATYATPTSARPNLDEPVEDVPVPVTILPKETCVENAQAEKEPIDFAYDPNYWSSMRSLVLSSEVFYILRSTNLRDRWSGQVGFPGGRKKKSESDLEAAARETFEEVGLELPYLAKSVHPNAAVVDENGSNAKFRYIGRLNDRVITQNNRRLVVSCLMYHQIVDKTPELKLAPSEVAACGWVPARHFLQENCASGMKVNLQTSFLGRKHAALAHVIRAMGVSSFVFVRILLPLTEMHVSLQNATEADRDTIKKNFSLWGLTLGLTSEMLVSTKLKTMPFALKSNGLLDWIQVDRVFDSPTHNLGIAAWTKIIETLSGQPLSWEQKITSYMLLVVVGVPVTVAVSSVSAFHLSGKL